MSQLYHNATSEQTDSESSDSEIEVQNYVPVHEPDPDPLTCCEKFWRCGSGKENLCYLYCDEQKSHWCVIHTYWFIWIPFVFAVGALTGSIIGMQTYQYGPRFDCHKSANQCTGYNSIEAFKFNITNCFDNITLPCHNCSACLIAKNNTFSCHAANCDTSSENLAVNIIFVIISIASGVVISVYVFCCLLTIKECFSNNG